MGTCLVHNYWYYDNYWYIIIGTYKSPSLSETIFTSEIKSILTFYWSIHNNMLLMGDFNTILESPNFNELIEDHELFALISELTCFKSINPTCIDNFLTSKKARFTNTPTLEMGVSDHHILIGTMLRSTFDKCKPKKIIYGCYKNFDDEKFEEELKHHLPSVLDFGLFHLAFKTTVDRFAPLKQKVV